MLKKLKKLLKIINSESYKKNVHGLDNLMLEKIRSKGYDQLSNQLSEKIKSEIDIQNVDNRFRLTFKSLTYGLSLTSFVALIMVSAGVYFYLDTSGLNYEEVETRDEPAYSSNGGYSEKDLMELMIKNTSESGYVSLDETRAKELTQQISDQITNKTVDKDLKNDIITKNVFEEEKVLEINFADGNKNLIIPIDRGFQVLSSTPVNNQILEFGKDLDSEISIIFTHEDFEMLEFLEMLEITPNLGGKFVKNGKVVIFQPENLQDGEVYTLRINQGLATNSGKKLQEDFLLRFTAKEIEVTGSIKKKNPQVLVPNSAELNNITNEEWIFDNNRGFSEDVVYYLQGDDIILDSENIGVLEIYRALNLSFDHKINILQGQTSSEELEGLEKELIVAKTNLPKKYNFNIVNLDSGDFLEVYLLNSLSGEEDALLAVAVFKDNKILRLTQLDNESTDLEYKLVYYDWIKDKELFVEKWNDVKINLYNKTFVEFESDNNQETWYYEKREEVENAGRVVVVEQDRGELKLLRNKIESGDYELEIIWKTDKGKQISRSWEMVL